MGNKTPKKNQEIKCYKEHKLSCISNNTLESKSYVCNFCKFTSTYNPGDKLNICTKCGDFYCCNSCTTALDFSAKNFANMFCLENHVLEPSLRVDYPGGIFMCDACGKFSKTNEICMRCPACQYDLCFCCSSIFGNKSVNLTINKINVFDKIKCNNNHRLMYVKHVPYPDKIYKCDGCNRTSHTDSHAVRCDECQYDLCLFCYFIEYRSIHEQESNKKVQQEEVIAKSQYISVTSKQPESIFIIK